MKDMVSGTDTKCPFEFNTDPATFKPGDTVSYRVPDSFDDMPFVGTILEVHDDHIILMHGSEQTDDVHRMRGTRESRPAVSSEDALGA